MLDCVCLYLSSVEGHKETTEGIEEF
jgi:hypothetical protein